MTPMLKQALSDLELIGEMSPGSVVALAIESLTANITAMDAEIERCHERLEIDHCWKMGLGDESADRFGFVRVDIPYEERFQLPDGIECRDIPKMLRQTEPDAPLDESLTPFAAAVHELFKDRADIMFELGPIETPSNIVYLNVVTQSKNKFRILFLPVPSFSTIP